MSRIQNTINLVSEIVLNSAAAAGIGYLCARAFMAINPVHVAVACAVSFAVSKATKPIFEKIYAGENVNEASRILGLVLHDIVVFTPLAVVVGCPVSMGSCLCLIAIFTSVMSAVNIGKASTEEQTRYIEIAYEL